MPFISRFYGIVITMYYELERHQQPHFHARYGDYKASYIINPLGILAGRMPRRQHNLITRWAKENQAALLDNWKRLEEDMSLNKIEGLQ